MKQIAVLFVMVGALVGWAGCAVKPLQIEPVSKKVATVVPAFDAACYFFDRDGSLHFAMRTNADDGMVEIFTARVFWRPVGGRTSLNPTSVNATWRYLLIAADVVGMYEGSGFVRLSGRNGQEMKVSVVDGDLRLTEASARFADVLGRARLRGSFVAEYDDAKAVEMIKEAQQEFFARSLLNKP
ncbi:MAG: hypothetical protein FWD53_08140 [Phycisphaerales bacterium]|nr:hypothetical protein [Phycisphaerales bacterium]